MVAMVPLHYFIPILKITPYPWNLTGIVLLIIGVCLNLVADAAFKRERTTVKPFEKSTALIVSGVFTLSRHPMYLGMILILLGIAILMGTLSPLIIVALFGILMELVFVETEERMLVEQFGERWLAYRNNVRKWI
jgi:protein-S-isoprenylcysteine O-methyltransferase Ste14